MHEPFIISVFYQGMEYEFKARFERWGYTHRIAVLIDELTFTFEPDEEGGYRALINMEQFVNVYPVNIQLLQKVAEKLAHLNNNSSQNGIHLMIDNADCL